MAKVHPDADATPPLHIDLRQALGAIERKLDFLTQHLVQPAPSAARTAVGAACLPGCVVFESEGGAKPKPVMVEPSRGIGAWASDDGIRSVSRLECDDEDLPKPPAVDSRIVAAPPDRRLSHVEPLWTPTMRARTTDEVEPGIPSRPSADKSMANVSRRQTFSLGSGVGQRHLVSSHLYQDTPHLLKTSLQQLGVYDFCERLEKRIEEAAEAKPGPLLRIVRGARFQGVCSVVIVASALFTGYSGNVELDEIVRGRARPTWIIAFGAIFSIFFLVELVLRAIAERLLFVFGAEWRWNLFDSAIVGLSLIDLAVNMISGGDNSRVPGVTVGRILRLARFFRLMRLARVFKHAHSLRLIVFAIMDSTASLCWCFVIVGFIIYVFAVLLVCGTAEFFRDQIVSVEDIENIHKPLMDLYGGIPEAMLSLFMAITGGADWRDLMSPLQSVNGAAYVPVFIFYVFFMYFGVLNVVVSAFVVTAADIAAQDKESLVKGEMSRFQQYTRRIKIFFREADLDKSGTLSWEEFRSHLDDGRVKAYFQALDLDVSQARILFDLLDVDGSDNVTVDEFLDGCLKLKGQARSIDMNLVVFMCNKLFAMLQEHVQKSDQEFARLRSFIEKSDSS
mmetsp:Transcript_91399/g.293580  ORF Transcript_91399/g.293580 Transcript_91399/m.293580 type:complete len:620 (+) Transcript_91399:97-1956(+)